jgi:dipeptidase D
LLILSTKHQIMTKITDLQPSGVFKYFDEVLKIPRPSKQEEKILAYLESFAKSLNLEYKKDTIGNLVIKKNASSGCEHMQGVVLQSHVDMVCEKNKDVEHDFTKDIIPAYVDGDWIRSKGTTLGADNGIGIAIQLALLSDDSIKHGPLECLFTVNEETGLTGARELEQGMFEGKILINLDSEDEGEIFIGCAGGIDTIVELSLEFEPSPKEYVFFRIVLSGLMGGHSGDDINKGYANSNLLLARFLWNAMQKFNIRLSHIDGGNLRNAIPREAEAVFGVDPKHVSALNDFMADFFKTLQSEFSTTEPKLNVDLQTVDKKENVFARSKQEDLINSLYSCPNGVMAMSQTVPGLVETSTNLASIKIKDGKAIIVTSQRSSIETAKKDISDRIKSNFSLVSAAVSNSDSYPGWTPDPKSEVLSLAEKAYEQLFNQKPKVKAIHAGLECGLFLDMYPGLDMISVGPTLKGVHSPDERMQISTVVKFWDFLLEILKNIPIKR